MSPVTIKTIKGKKYAYLEKSVRLGATVRKVSHYLGPAPPFSRWKVAEATAEYQEEFLQKEVVLRMQQIQATITSTFPLTEEEIKKIEEMNVKYRQIMKNLHPKSREDLNKRFVANYVFESNALEGNTLTLKNVAEIVFEKRISSGQDLREIYDAQNSYNLYLYLQKTRQEINSDFIIKIHALLMDKIDDRLGFRKVPIMLVGKPMTLLSKPEEVEKEMDNLVKWYRKQKGRSYPLELAFKFHAKFEKIHPFCDGNGRVGRFLLNYILLRKKYFPIIIRKTTRNSYLNALEAADQGAWIVLMRFALKHYKETFRKFFEVYYQYAK